MSKLKSLLIYNFLIGALCFDIANLLFTRKTNLFSSLKVDGYISYQTRTENLRTMINSNEMTIMPCCYDGLSARIVEAAGFNLTFMTGK